jgi:glycosyltransferase involved in cell wall biosynthesis
MNIPISESPLFSVIVASYNNGRYLDEMIRSVVNQSWTNWELIIAENLGAGAAFNTAAANCHGEIIGMLGADDALVSNSLERMIDAHKMRSDASLITSLALGCDNNLKNPSPYAHCRNLKPEETLIRNLHIGSFVTFKLAAYKQTEGFNRDFKRAVDHDLFLKLDEVGSIAGIDEYLYLYRLHEGGISQGESGVKAYQFSMMARINAYHRRKGTLKENLTKSEYRDLKNTWYLREAFVHRWKNRRKCNQLLIEAFTFNPAILLKREFLSVFVRNNFLGI